MLNLWCPPYPTLGWSGYRSFQLKTQKLSAGSSSLHPASAIQYIRRLDALVVTLFDGSFHVLHRLSTDPSLSPGSSEDLVISERISQAVRSVFVRSEQNVDFGAMNRITGLASYDGCATFIWLQE